MTRVSEYREERDRLKREVAWAQEQRDDAVAELRAEQAARRMTLRIVTDYVRAFDERFKPTGIEDEYAALVDLAGYPS